MFFLILWYWPKLTNIFLHTQLQTVTQMWKTYRNCIANSSNQKIQNFRENAESLSSTQKNPNLSICTSITIHRGFSRKLNLKLVHPPLTKKGLAPSASSPPDAPRSARRWSSAHRSCPPRAAALPSKVKVPGRHRGGWETWGQKHGKSRINRLSHVNLEEHFEKHGKSRFNNANFWRCETWWCLWHRMSWPIPYRFTDFLSIVRKWQKIVIYSYISQVFLNWTCICFEDFVAPFRTELRSQAPFGASKTLKFFHAARGSLGWSGAAGSWFYETDLFLRMITKYHESWLNSLNAWGIAIPSSFGFP